VGYAIRAGWVVMCWMSVIEFSCRAISKPIKNRYDFLAVANAVMLGKGAARPLRSCHLRPITSRGSGGGEWKYFFCRDHLDRTPKSRRYPCGRQRVAIR
jgi:hypothetical protein